MRDRFVYVGPYAVVTYLQIDVKTTVHRCKADATHQVSKVHKFCPTCGNPTIDGVKTEQMPLSIDAVLFGEDYTEEHLSSDDYNWLHKHFQPGINGDQLGLPDTKEVIFFKNTLCVDFDHEGIKNFKPDDLKITPTIQKQFDRLKKVLKLTKAELKIGIVCSDA